MAAVAVARALEEHRLRPGIKWPNDILLGGKKLCGILTETGPSRDNRPSIVLGVGLNVNQTSGEFPAGLRKTATSLRATTKRTWDRDGLLGSLLDHLEEEYSRLSKGQGARLINEWGRRNVTLGREVRISQGRQVLGGTAIGLDKSGALVVRLKSGEVRKILSGDVALSR
jgi:BirA family biotin operon repressor/biotin-[acetyl-CoA-carboxylase] ligase